MAKLGRPVGSKNKPKVPEPPPRKDGRAFNGSPPRAGKKQFLRMVGELKGLPGDEEREQRVKHVKGPKKPQGPNPFPIEYAAYHGLPGVSYPRGSSTAPGTLQGLSRPSQRELVARVAASGLTPLDYMLSILRDTAQSKIRRDWAAERCAPYCHSRLASVVHTGKGGGPIQTLDLSKISDEQLAVLEAIFGTLVQSSGDASGTPEGADST